MKIESNQKYDESTPEGSKKEKDRKIIETAQKRFKLAQEATTDIRTNGLDDLKFRAGDQWPDEIKRDRDEYNRPCLTINQLPQFTRQVTNDLRQNRPSLTASPVDDDADIETAEIIQGMFRHIEYDSNAELAYDTAVSGAVNNSFGYFRVVTEYSDDMSFEQDIKIKRIRNPFSVYMDPTCQEPDESDAKWGFITEDLTRDEYEEQYPDSELASLNDWMSVGDMGAGWVMAQSVRVAEYYEVCRTEKTILRLSDNRVVLEETFEKNKDGTYNTGNDKVLVIDKRKTHIRSVKWCKINAVEILEETEWLGSWVPIIPVRGEELDIDGRLVLESCIRHAKDPQRMVNFWASAETEMIALAPKAPWVGVEGQFEDHEEEFANSNNESMPYLEYKPITIGDKAAPPPTRNVYEPPVQAITNARAVSIEDLKATIGMYDPSLGKGGNEVSARAILARKSGGHTTNFHYSDNLSRAMKHLGRIVMQLIPKIYDEPRVIRIVSESGVHKQVKINQQFTDKEAGGVSKIYDLTIGKYDVTINAGPSYETKRQETAACMMEVISAYPTLMQTAGDLLVKHFDWPGAQELAARLQKLLPPALQDGDDSKIPPQVKVQMQQMQTLIQRLTAELNKASQKIEGKTEKIQSDERIALMRVQADLIKTMATINSEEAKHAFQLEVDHINTLLKVEDASNPDEAVEKTTADLTGQNSNQN